MCLGLILFMDDSSRVTLGHHLADVAVQPEPVELRGGHLAGAGKCVRGRRAWRRSSRRAGPWPIRWRGRRKESSSPGLRPWGPARMDSVAMSKV